MREILNSARASLAFGLMAAAAVLAAFLALAGGDLLSLLSFAIRFLHVLSAAVWIGLIVYVNFVQLAALRAADGGERELINRLLLPGVAWWMRHASTATVIAGALLLLTSGYVLPTLVYGSAVYVPPSRAALIWPAVVGALAMWTFVHMYIWPGMQLILGTRPGDDAAKQGASARVAVFARLTLILAAPVMLAMLAAAHLY